MYSGSWTPDSRPTGTGLFKTFDAPNCTHFILALAQVPDYTTGNALLHFMYVEKDTMAYVMASNNAGSGQGSSANAFDFSPTEQPTKMVGSIAVNFDSNVVSLDAKAVTATARLPQVGKVYKWYAW